MYRSSSKDSGNNIIRNSKESYEIATGKQTFVLVLGAVATVRYTLGKAKSNVAFLCVVLKPITVQTAPIKYVKLVLF